MCDALPEHFSNFRLNPAVIHNTLANTDKISACEDQHDEMIPEKLHAFAVLWEHEDQMLRLPLEKYLKYCTEKWEEAQEDFPSTGMQDFLIHVGDRLEATPLPEVPQPKSE